jgi:hypothetical protein
MADKTITETLNIRNHLEDEMRHLKDLVYKMQGLTTQILCVSAGISRSWVDLEVLYKTTLMEENLNK